MKLYITLTFHGFGNDQEAAEHLCALVKTAGWEDFCFIRDVENYQKKFDSPKDLMQRAREEILNCDGLMIDITEQSPGKIIEAGIAFSSGKKIIVLVKKGLAVRETVKGIADAVIEYEQLEDIVLPLRQLAQKWQPVKIC